MNRSRGMGNFEMDNLLPRLGYRGRYATHTETDMTQSPSQFFVNVMGEVSGPFTASQIRDLAASGRLFPDSFVRKGINGKWRGADRVKGLRFSNQQNATKKPNVETGREPTNSRPKHRLLIYSLLVIGLIITISCIGYVYSRNLSTDSIEQSQVAKASSDTKVNKGDIVL